MVGISKTREMEKKERDKWGEIMKVRTKFSGGFGFPEDGIYCLVCSDSRNGRPSPPRSRPGHEPLCTRMGGWGEEEEGRSEREKLDRCKLTQWLRGLLQSSG